MSRYVGVLLTDMAGEYLDDLARTGLYGDTVDAIAEHMMMVGIQRAVEIGAIRIRVAPLPEIEPAPEPDELEQPF